MCPVVGMSDPMVRVFTLIPVPVPVVIPLPQLLTYALTCNVLDLDSVTVHISQMKSVLGKAAMVPILQDIMDRIGDNEAPSPPKYHAPSVMQPELRCAPMRNNRDVFDACCATCHHIA